MRITPDGTTAEDIVRKQITFLDEQIPRAGERAAAYDQMAADERADVAAMQKLRDELTAILEPKNGPTTARTVRVKLVLDTADAVAAADALRERLHDLPTV
ncbi:MAG: hypothetical protein ACRDT9_00210 [Agromyces sp.]